MLREGVSTCQHVDRERSHSVLIAPMTAENDNRPPPRVIPIIGYVADDGEVTITRPDLLPRPEPHLQHDPCEA